MIKQFNPTVGERILAFSSPKTSHENTNKKIWLFFLLLFCTGFHLMAQNGTNPAPGAPSYQPECCPKDGSPCSLSTDIIVGQSYTYNIVFDLNNAMYTADITNLELAIYDPTGASLVPTNLNFFYASTGNPVVLPFAMAPYATVELQASFEIVLAPTAVYLGDYEFIVRVSGTKYVPKAVSFYSTSSLFHSVTNSSEQCPEPTTLEPVSGGSKRLGGNSLSLSTSWHPNPTHNGAILELKLDQDSKLDVEILNMQGQSLLKPIQGEKLSQGTHRKKLDVSNLPAGIYYTRITSESGSEVIKWVKLE